jgi:hypothetical protein
MNRILLFCLFFCAPVRALANDNIVFAHLIEKAPYISSLSGLIAHNLEPADRLFIENYSSSSLEEVLNRLNTQNSFLTIYYKISEVENTIFLSGPRTPTNYIGETAVQFAETIRKNLAHALSEWEVHDLGELPFAEMRDSGSAHIFIHVPQNIDLEKFSINICSFITTTFPSHLKSTVNLITATSVNKTDLTTPSLSPATQNTASVTNTKLETEENYEQNTSAEFDENSLAELSRELLMLSQQQNFTSEMPGLDNFSSKRRNTAPQIEPAFSISSTFNSQSSSSDNKIPIQTTVSDPLISSIPSLPVTSGATPLINYSSIPETEPSTILTGSPFLPPGTVLELLPYEEEYNLETENPAPPSWLAAP